jgi:hypothetical protein
VNDSFDFIESVLAMTHEFKTWDECVPDMIEGQEENMAKDHNRMLETLQRLRVMAEREQVKRSAK